MEGFMNSTRNQRRSWKDKNKEKVRAYNQKKRQAYQKYWATHDPYVETTVKKCGKCKKELLSVDFYRDSSTKDGLNGHCEDCAYLKNSAGATSRMLSKAKTRAKAK